MNEETSEYKPLPNSLEEALLEIKELRLKLAVLKPLESLSGTLGASIDKIMQHGCLANVKDNFVMATDDDPRYLVWLDMQSLKIARASRAFRKRMKWPLQKIIEASDNVEGVKKFSQIIDEYRGQHHKEKSEQKQEHSFSVKSDSIYHIKAADNRTIYFKPNMMIFDAGPFAARIELGEFDKLNNFFYNTLFVSKKNKIVLPEKVEFTRDLIQKVSAAYASHNEIAFYARDIKEVDPTALKFFKRYLDRNDCKFNLIVDPKREARDKNYSDLLDSFVNAGFHWDRMRIESKKPVKAPETPLPENYVAPAPI